MAPSPENPPSWRHKRRPREILQTPDPSAFYSISSKESNNDSTANWLSTFVQGYTKVEEEMCSQQ